MVTAAEAIAIHGQVCKVAMLRKMGKTSFRPGVHFMNEYPSASLWHVLHHRDALKNAGSSRANDELQLEHYTGSRWASVSSVLTDAWERSFHLWKRMAIYNDTLIHFER